MKTLPIRKIPGIGKVMETTLNFVGIETCGDVLEKVRFSFKSIINLSRSIWCMKE